MPINVAQSTRILTTINRNRVPSWQGKLVPAYRSHRLGRGRCRESDAILPRPCATGYKRTGDGRRQRFSDAGRDRRSSVYDRKPIFQRTPHAYDCRQPSRHIDGHAAQVWLEPRYSSRLRRDPTHARHHRPLDLSDPDHVRRFRPARKSAVRIFPSGRYSFSAWTHRIRAPAHPAASSAPPESSAALTSECPASLRSPTLHLSDHDQLGGYDDRVLDPWTSGRPSHHPGRIELRAAGGNLVEALPVQSTGGVRRKQALLVSSHALAGRQASPDHPFAPGYDRSVLADNRKSHCHVAT